MRESGFYWLKSGDAWTIGEWSEGGWCVIGSDGFWSDENMEQIGERIPDHE